jgi:hypothetical protein
VAQARDSLVFGVLLLAAACGGRSTEPAPASPEAAVRGFLNAVRAGSLQSMSSLWGSGRGPARTYMPADELEQRLVVIRTYLAHEQFELVEPSAELLPTADRRVVQVRLTRNGCTPVVPFTVVRYGSGWLVSEIDLAAAGNPQRSCRPMQPSGNPRDGSRH